MVQQNQKTTKKEVEAKVGKDKKSKYTLKRIKKRLIEEGYMVEECSICGWNEERITDGLICLGLDFLDGDSSHTTLENMRLLCPNCYLSNNGVLHNSKVFCK